ncbi:type VI secretion system tip protein TssI/VgrG [Hydrogenophaga sp.]|uniref:type VI secretion system tip protein TssI/VgrG n=1 Tax=Hydrogenophaga sp. TaxID=1904254 RepID=UPI00286E5BFF|nr:type VI secretion system tip protein TssI/VgrG [Hydrogenophaga sp.]
MGSIREAVQSLHALINDQRQARRILKLSFPKDDGPAATLLVANKLDAHEGLSRDFRYTVEILSDRSDIPLKDVLGKMMSIELARTDGGQRWFNGYVFDFRFIKNDAGFTYYQAELRPWMAFLRYRQDNYLFHGKTVEEQTALIFGDYVQADWRVRDLGADPVMTDACQFDESDHNYLHRRWEAMGWHYGYEHRKDGHTLVLSGDSTACDPIDGSGCDIAWQGDNGVRKAGMLNFAPVRQIASTQYAASSFDFKRPNPLKADLPTLNEQGLPPTLTSALEVYEYAGAYGVKDEIDGDDFVRLRMQEIEAAAKHFEGSGDDDRVQPGRMFRLTGHRDFSLLDQGEDEADFLITEVHHLASNNYAAGAATPSEYSHQLRCLRKKIPWHPGRGFSSTEPKIYGLQTALVVGPAGEEIHTDEYGRVRVQFHWDREGAYNEKSSAWVRVASTWAGSNFGFVAIPRIGQEVLVQFLDGNPDRPLITGRVYNQDNMPPWDLPANKTQTGLLSRSSQGGGYDNANALRFEDKKGQEEVWLHAEKDQRIEVEHCENHSVGVDRSKSIGNNETVSVGNNRSESVGVDESINIGNNRTESVGVNETIHVGVNRRESVGVNESVSVGVARSLSVGVSDSTSVGVSQSTSVGKKQSNSVGKMRTETIGLLHMQNVGLMHMQSTGMVGTSSVGLYRSDSAGMNWSQSAGEKMTLTVGDTYSISCGASSLTMKSDGTITLTGTEVTVNGGGSASTWNANCIGHVTTGQWIEFAASHSMVGPASKGGEGADSDGRSGSGQMCTKESANSQSTCGSISFSTGAERITHTDFSLPAPMPLTWSRTYCSTHVANDDATLGARWTNRYTTRIAPIDPSQAIATDPAIQHLLVLRYHAADGRSHDLPLPSVGAEYFDAVEKLTLKRLSADLLQIAMGPDWRETYERAALPAMDTATDAPTAHRWRLVRLEESAGKLMQLYYAAPELDEAPADGVIAAMDAVWPRPLASAEANGDHLSDVISFQGQGASARPLAHVRLRYNARGKIGSLWQVQVDASTASDANPQDDLTPGVDSMSAQLLGLIGDLPHDQHKATELTRCLACYGHGEHGDLIWALSEDHVPTLTAEGLDSAEGAETIKAALDNAWHYGYQDHLLTRYTDRTGCGMNLEYSGPLPPHGLPRAVREWADDGSFAATIAWTEGTGTVKAVDALGHDTTYVFDRLGFTQRIVHPDGSTERFVRDRAHNVVEHHQVDGAIVRQQFDEGGRLIGKTSPGGTRTRQHFDAQGRLTLLEDALGRLWRREYNQQGLMVSSTDPLGRVTRYEYDTKGQLGALIDAKGGRKTFAYTDQGQRASHTDCSGKTTRMAYDDAGRLQSVTDAAGGQTLYTYDRGQVSAITHPDGGCVTYERDAEGRLIRQTDPNGHSTEHRYGPSGQLIEQRNALGNSLRFEWDKNGRLTTLVNENQARYHFTYDAAGRLTQETDFDGQETRYQYDKGRLIASHTVGLTTTYGYDADGRMTQRSASEIDDKGQPVLSSSLSEHFQYDALGRMTWAKNADSRVQFLYDEVGNLSQEVCHYDFLRNGLSMVWRHEYDELGNRICTTRPDGEKLHWLVYGSGHVHGLVWERPQQGNETPERIELLGYERDDLHRAIRRTQGNGLQQTLKLDPVGRMLEQTVTTMRSAAGEAHLHGNGASVAKPLIHRRYSYDAAGLLGAIDDQLRGRTEYRYDETGRLVRAHHGLPLDGVQAPNALSLLEQFAFDPAGNLLGNSAKPNDHELKYLQRVVDNRLPSFVQKDADGTEQTVHYQYDARGQRIGKGVTKGERNGVWDTEYRWNVFGRLAGVRTRTLQAQYQYDPLGRRLGKTVHVNGTFRDAQEQQRADASLGYGQTIFSWEGDLLSLEITEHTGLIHNLYEIGGFVPAVQIQKQSWNPLTAQPHFVQCDHLGTPQEITDGNGLKIWAAELKAFGQLNKLDSNSGNIKTHELQLKQKIQFQGQYLDGEVNLHYNLNRYFDPQSGNYLSKDPIGLNGDSNLFSYASGSPVNHIDPLGLVSFVGQVGGSWVPGVGAEGNLGAFLTLYKGRVDFGFYSQGGLSVGAQSPGLSGQVGLIKGDVNTIRGVTKNFNVAAPLLCGTAMTTDKNELLGATIGGGAKLGGSMTYSDTGAWSASEALGRMFDKYLGKP